MYLIESDLFSVIKVTIRTQQAYSRISPELLFHYRANATHTNSIRALLKSLYSKFSKSQGPRVCSCTTPTLHMSVKTISHSLPLSLASCARFDSPPGPPRQYLALPLICPKSQRNFFFHTGTGITVYVWLFFRFHFRVVKRAVG